MIEWSRVEAWGELTDGILGVWCIASDTCPLMQLHLDPITQVCLKGTHEINIAYWTPLSSKDPFQIFMISC